MHAVPFFPNTGENYARDKELGQNLCYHNLSKPGRVLKSWYSAWAPRAGIYFGAVLVSSVAQATSHYRNKMQDSVLINHQHAIDFHRCISFHVGIVDHANSRNGLDQIFLFVLLHIADYYFCFWLAGYVPSFCAHPNPTEFRPSTSSQFYSQSKKVQSSNYRLCRSAKVPLLWNHFLTRFNLYQSGLAFFTFLLCLSPTQFWWRNQFITWRPVANPPLLTSWVKKQQKKENHYLKLVITEGYGCGRQRSKVKTLCSNAVHCV